MGLEAAEIFAEFRRGAIARGRWFVYADARDILYSGSPPTENVYRLQRRRWSESPETIDRRQIHELPGEPLGVARITAPWALPERLEA